jgi:hypothetical protein
VVPGTIRNRVVKTAATAAHRGHKAQSKGRLGTRVSGTNPERALETPAWCVQSWASSNKKPRIYWGFCEAAEGTRTLDLLHGKQIERPQLQQSREVADAESSMFSTDSARLMPNLMPIRS